MKNGEMASYRVTLIRHGIKTGDIVPYGSVKEITIRNVGSKTEARRIAKDKAGKDWSVGWAEEILGPLDPDAYFL